MLKQTCPKCHETVERSDDVRLEKCPKCRTDFPHIITPKTGMLTGTGN